MHDTNTPEGATRVLATLRRLNRNRPLELSEALWIAERQANRLLQLRGRVQHRMLAKANIELTALSSTDRLTGLPNRRSTASRVIRSA